MMLKNSTEYTSMTANLVLNLCAKVHNLGKITSCYDIKNLDNVTNYTQTNANINIKNLDNDVKYAF